MRLTLNADEVEILLKLTKYDYLELHSKIEKQLQDDTQRDISKKQEAIKQATKSRTDDAKAKINNAIRLLRLELRELTIYAIAKESGCSYNTVKKYYKVGLK